MIIPVIIGVCLAIQAALVGYYASPWWAALLIVLEIPAALLGARLGKWLA